MQRYWSRLSTAVRNVFAETEAGLLPTHRGDEASGGGEQEEEEEELPPFSECVRRGHASLVGFSPVTAEEDEKKGRAISIWDFHRDTFQTLHVCEFGIEHTLRWMHETHPLVGFLQHPERAERPAPLFDGGGILVFSERVVARLLRDISRECARQKLPLTEAVDDAYLRANYTTARYVDEREGGAVLATDQGEDLIVCPPGREDEETGLRREGEDTAGYELAQELCQLAGVERPTGPSDLIVQMIVVPTNGRQCWGLPDVHPLARIIELYPRNVGDPQHYWLDAIDTRRYGACLLYSNSLIEKAVEWVYERYYTTAANSNEPQVSVVIK